MTGRRALLEGLDGAAEAVLDRLVAAVPNTRLMVVCLARPLLFERRPSWGEGQEIHTWIDLKPLSRRASRALVREILQKAGEVPGDLRDLIVEGAEALHQDDRHGAGDLRCLQGLGRCESSL